MASPAALNVHPHFNAEEAASAAVEFVASLDNLPGEVTFILQEIKEKDKRIEQLLNRINARHFGLTKSARQLASASSSAAAAPPSFPLPLAPGSPLPTAHLAAKDAQSLSKIQAEWGKIDDLQADKIRLAARLERIVSRARERGRAEWRRVGGVDIDEVEMDKPVVDVGAEVMLPPTGLGGDRQKKRKPLAVPLPQPSTPSLSLTTSMPPPSAPAGARPSLGAARTQSRTARADRHLSISTTMSDIDADGEVELGGMDEGDADDTPYCFCRQKSYGEMVGCDNDKCRYEWFHIKCVNVQLPLPDAWYCPECTELLGINERGVKDKKARKK